MMRPAAPMTIASVRAVSSRLRRRRAFGAEIFAADFLALSGEQPPAEHEGEAEGDNPGEAERGQAVGIGGDEAWRFASMAGRRAREAEDDRQADQEQQQAGP